MTLSNGKRLGLTTAHIIRLLTPTAQQKPSGVSALVLRRIKQGDKR